MRTGGLGTGCVYSHCPAVPNAARFTKLFKGTAPESGDLCAILTYKLIMKAWQSHFPFWFLFFSSGK